MRLATVVGNITLSVSHPEMRGERLLMAMPWTEASFADREKTGFSIVVYDELGADVGQVIGVSEGREAACPFDPPRPVDAYCAALIDEVYYQEKEPK